jgi:ribosomal protein S18 acetylase RimI-like enzyme
LRTAHFLSQAGATFAGCHDPRIIEWLCARSAAASRNVFAVTASREEEVLGSVLAVRREFRLALEMIPAAPAQALRALAHLVFLGIKTIFQRRTVDRPNWTGSFGKRNVKILLVTTLPSARGLGVARNLYDLLRRALREQADVDWLIARIDKANLASIKLHRAAGWNVETDAHYVFSWRAVTDAA